ncbi:hypothetical protein ACIA98_01390 [Streptomyces sp. NPDC051366]|uniref:hypothetical protein n=1 Tax=Streptomyces sp. NPDC051366 TaxID=3365652 RepID=UPI0037A6EFC8
MRIRTVIATATTLTALLTLTACGSDDGAYAGDIASVGGIGAGGDGNGGAPKKGNGLGIKGLVKAGSMAEATRIVGRYTKCTEVSKAQEGYDPGEGPDDKYGSAYSVTERGWCNDRGDTGIFLIKDPKAFQTAFKADVDKEYAKHPNRHVNMGFVIGQDFAVGSQSTDTMTAMLNAKSGMVVLNCHPAFNPPSGYRKEPALVKGCVLTDYLSEE